MNKRWLVRARRFLDDCATVVAAAFIGVILITGWEMVKQIRDNTAVMRVIMEKDYGRLE